ncbi:hypothetical protein OHB26_09495 [Nocardia sp. NBC_01503]|uniref:hypothetical protein n=1 Tax=Nocardia sp. NBC_01503 TaxID=2975997 RepID=UPI002E7B128F|nr:hypothetical protein [Nocardia sp. NBC_01503]WTL34409.1 hypothetical protein OHB26_09495 [Nocardia sp. NBC_01503]
MNASDRPAVELARLKAEMQRTEVVADVLSDVLDAALDVKARKRYKDCDAEDQRIEHWQAVHDSAWTDRDAALDAFCAVEYGPEFVKGLRAMREPKPSAPQRSQIERSR